MAKQFTPDVKQVFLKPDEAKFLAIMVAQYLTDYADTAGHSWNEEGQKTRKEMHAAATALKIKLEKLGFNVAPLPPYEAGDEKEFINQ